MSKRRKLERPTHVLSCLTIVAAMATSQLAHAEHANADGAADSDVEALLAMMQADEQAANAEERTLEQEAAMMQATREEAAAHGVNEKSHGEHGEHGWAGSMARRFERFLARHGERLGYPAGYPNDSEVEPSLKLVRSFVDYCASGAARVNFSCVSRKADNDKYFELHLPYTLAQRCFPMLKLPGWVGFDKTERRQKAVPLKDTIQEHWKSINTELGFQYSRTVHVQY